MRPPDAPTSDAQTSDAAREAERRPDGRSIARGTDRAGGFRARGLLRAVARIALGAGAIGLLAAGLIALGRGDLPSPTLWWRQAPDGFTVAGLAPRPAGRTHWILAATARSFDPRRAVVVLGDGSRRVLPRESPIVLVDEEGRVTTSAPAPGERDRWLERASTLGVREPIERAFALAR